MERHIGFGEIGMKHLVGKNKKWDFILLAVFFILFSTNKFLSSSMQQVNLGEDFYFIITSPTIHLISQKNGTVDGYPVQGEHSLVRGKIEFLYFDDSVISGYLSTRFFKEDGLIGLERRNDKEGFFIIDKSIGSVEAGLTGDIFFSRMEQRYHQKNIKFLRPDEIELK